jgi:GNAT superfamily N-acetyltransferase
VGPRDRYARLNSPRARVYRRIDDAETWVVTCFFIAKQHRGTGVATALLDAAVDFATERGATIIEGYPIDRSVTPRRASDLFVGTLSMFSAAGFEEVYRAGDRPLVRRQVGSS